MGSNMAENHPVAFRWPMVAKANGATLIHVDPRFTRTSAVADLHAPVRAGSDIAFLGGLVNHVINSERWNREPFFKTWLVQYTNAATIITEEFKDTEDLDGVFSGLVEYTGGVPEWPYNGFVGQYDNKSWQYARGGRSGAQGEAAAYTARAGDAGAGHTGAQPKGPRSGEKPGQVKAPPGPPFDPLVKSLLKGPPVRDETLRDPRCVFQHVKRHFGRYTPEMVERVTGCPKELFLKVAETILANSGPDRTTSFAYAVAWTQHTYGPQMIGCCALLQLLLGNMGRPGGGIMALRGHASIQGSTDVPTLYHSIHGYLPAPSALKKHDTLHDYLVEETVPTGYYANTPKFLVSYLKSMWGRRRVHPAGGSRPSHRRPARRDAGARSPAPGLAVVTAPAPAPPVRPAQLCAALLSALDGSEGRMRRRKRDQTPDRIGLSIKRALLEGAVRDDPAPDAFEAWLLERCLAGEGQAGVGAVRAMAMDVLLEWRLARSVPSFGEWLARGAPSDDAVPDRPAHDTV
jgi:anaerobic selenocysteine-containing dehydrogenase